MCPVIASIIRKVTIIRANYQHISSIDHDQNCNTKPVRMQINYILLWVDIKHTLLLFNAEIIQYSLSINLLICIKYKQDIMN